MDVGVNGTTSKRTSRTCSRDTTSTSESGLHLGAGLRRELAKGSIGARLELDDIDGDLLLAVRALDYRRHLTQRFAVTAFLGAARLDLATPAYGYYLGARRASSKTCGRAGALGSTCEYGDKIARDNLLPTDPQGGKPDNFYDLSRCRAST